MPPRTDAEYPQCGRRGRSVDTYFTAHDFKKKFNFFTIFVLINFKIGTVLEPLPKSALNPWGNGGISIL